MTCTTTELHGFLRSRRSVRRFKPDPVPEPVLRGILSTAMRAPSAHNRQPWRFAVITGAASKANLSAAMCEDFERDLLADGIPPAKIQAQIERSRERLTSAPVVILLCLDMSEMDTYPDAKRQRAERAMTVQSVAAAGLQLLLAAHAEGLGGVWVCSPLFAPETVQHTLQLPESWEPQAMFYMGYAAVTPPRRERKSVEEISIFL